VHSLILERDPGPGDEVLDGRGDEYLARARQIREPRSDMDSDPPDVVTQDLDLPGVYAIWKPPPLFAYRIGLAMGAV
jgi:hypothetical protein